MISYQSMTSSRLRTIIKKRIKAMGLVSQEANYRDEASFLAPSLLDPIDESIDKCDLASEHVERLSRGLKETMCRVGVALALRSRRMEELGRQKELLTEQVEDLEVQVDELKHEREQLEEDLRQLDVDRDHWWHSYRECEEENTELYNKNDELRTRIAQLQESYGAFDHL